MSDPEDRAPAEQARPSFLDELKQRRVPRVALVYLAAGFAIVEAADIALPRLGLPDWTVTLVLALLLLGFPLVIGISWAFDWTPDGLVKAPAPGPRVLEPPHEAADRSRVAWFGTKTVAATVVFMALGVGIAGGWFIRPAMVDSAVIRAGPPKVAVLPFRNANVGDGENASLALGIHDDLLTRISRILAFRVNSRTSVMEYADTELSIPEIAAALGADFVLEGGVQRAGSSVRINVQLIDGRTDEHMWAETYDAPFDIEQLFGIQSRIAEQVAIELEATLSPDEAAAIASVPTTDSVALRLYHDAWRSYYAGGNDEVSMRSGIARLEAAVDRDPGFAEAWSVLSILHADMGWYGHDVTETRVEAAFDAARRALETGPDVPLAHYALGNAHYHGRSDYGPAVDAYNRALQLDPSLGPALLGIGAVLRRQGRMFEAIDALERGLELDPRSPLILVTLAESFQYVRRFEAADSAFRAAGAQDPTQPFSYLYDLPTRYLRLGTVSVSEAVEALDRAEALGAIEPAAQTRIGVGLQAGDRALFERGVSALPEDHVNDGQFTWRPIELERARWAFLSNDAEAQREHATRGASRIEAWLRDNPDDDRAWGELGIARALSGDTAGALEAIERGLDLTPFDRDFVRAVRQRAAQVMVLGLIGRSDDAFEVLDSMVDLPSGDFAAPFQLETIPLLRPLREDPRWAPLLARLAEPLPRSAG